MKLKPVIAKLDDVDEKYRDLYTERDGKFYLEVDGMVDKSKLDEFRNNNITLDQQLKQYTSLGLNLDELKAAAETARKLREKELIDSGDVETLIKERMQAVHASHTEEVAKLNEQLTKSNSQLSVLMIDNVIRDNSIKSGVLPTAVDDVLLRARNVFKVKEGNIIATDADGKPMYAKDGSELTVTQYISDLSKAAPHLFKSSDGSGANTHQQGGNGTRSTEGMTPKQKMAAGLTSRDE